jgi:SulP family sulfate permease
MAGTRHDPNQELIGLGLANLLAPLLGGFAATGAIARTATNVRNGATGPLAGVIHALTLVGVLLVLAPLAADVPLAVLAAILFVVAWNMSEARHFAGMLRRAPRADVVILLVTFGLTVFADLVVAVNIGVILAMLHFMRRMASSVEVRPANAQELVPALAAAGLPALPADTLVYTLDGPFFFGAVENFERALSVSSVPQVLVFNLRWVPFVDITALQTFEDAIRRFRARGVQVLLAGANDRVQRKLARAGVLALLESGQSFATLGEALQRAAALGQGR